MPTKLTEHELYQQSKVFEKGFPLDQVSKRLQRALKQEGVPRRTICATAYGWDGKRYSAHLRRQSGKVYIHDSTFERYQTLYVKEPPRLLWLKSNTPLSTVIDRWWINSRWWMLLLDGMVSAFKKRAR